MLCKLEPQEGKDFVKNQCILLLCLRRVAYFMQHKFQECECFQLYTSWRLDKWFLFHVHQVSSMPFLSFSVSHHHGPQVVA